MSERIEKAKEILEKIEDNLEIDYLHQRGRKFQEASKLFKKAGKDEKAKQLDWEAQLFYVDTSDEQQPNPQGERFTTLQQLLENLPSEAFDYFKERSQEAENPIHKAHINDFLWDANIDQAYEHAEKAIEAYLKCVSIYLENEQYIDLNDVLLRSATLANHLNNKALQQKVIKVGVDYVENFVDQNQYGKILNPLKAILRVEGQLTDEDLKKLARYAEEGSEFHENNNDYLPQRMLLELLIDINDSLGKEEIIAKLQEDIVDSFLQEAEYKRENDQYETGVDAIFVQKALSAAQEFQLADRIADLKRMVKGANRRLAEQMPAIEVGGELPTSSIDEYTDELLEKPINEALEVIASDDSLVFSYNESVQLSEEWNEDFVTRQLLPRNYISQDGSFSRPLSKNERAEILAMKDFCRNIQIQGLMLMRLFSRLQKEGEFDKESFIGYLSDWELMTQDDLPFIKRGIENYFDENYIDATHILVPRIENIIRHLFELNEFDISHFQRNYKGRITWLSKKTLNQLFGEPGEGDKQAKELLGERLYYYFYAILLSKNCFNLRNDVAHGFLRAQLCNKNVASLVIHLLILLTGFQLEPLEQPEEE